jgi:predicted phage terminase large subunit-like protein
MDSILMSLINNKSWTTKLYRAHRDFDDFSELLWPEQWPESELRKIRQEYIDAGYSEGYSSEYLNDPIANTEAYFRKVDFLPIEEEMRNLPTNNYAALDLAISDSDKAAYTVITVGGMDQYRRLLLKRVIRFRGDANEIINTMIAVQQQYDIQLWKVEEGQIKSTLMGPLIEKMNETGIYLNISGGNPGKDKRGRARGIQARMRAGGVYFDKEAPWYPAFEQELLQFPKGMYKDQVDSFAWLGIAINELSEGPSIREYIEEDYIDTYEDSMRVGASPVTGY